MKLKIENHGFPAKMKYKSQRESEAKLQIIMTETTYPPFRRKTFSFHLRIICGNICLPCLKKGRIIPYIN